MEPTEGEVIALLAPIIGIPAEKICNTVILATEHREDGKHTVHYVHFLPDDTALYHFIQACIIRLEEKWPARAQDTTVELLLRSILGAGKESNAAAPAVTPPPGSLLELFTNLVNNPECGLNLPADTSGNGNDANPSLYN